MTQAPPLSNIPEYTVGEVSAAVRRNLEAEFARVRVRGEISGFKRAASGHLYFNLKDDRAVLNAVCWHYVAPRLGIGPEDGLEVVATGRVTAYGPRSAYQLVVDALDLAGEGALLKLLEERRRRLAEEGLFDAGRKRQLPFLPERIGVVTSLGGAVLHDILHRLRERFPRHVLVWPVPVQGDGAAERIVEAMDGMGALPSSMRPDVLIVARGGGSLEDLWAFNEEAVVRAAARSAIPLISAVGHETDTTLIDFAADRRAPTPSAAAEMAVPVRAELLARTGGQGERLLVAGARLVQERRERIAGLARGLPAPTVLLEQASQRLDDRGERMEAGLRARVEQAASRAAALSARFGQPRVLVDAQRERLAALDTAFLRAGRRMVEAKADRLERLDAGRRLPAAWSRLAENAAARLARGLPAPTLLLEQASQRLDDRGERMEAGFRARVEQAASRAAALSGRFGQLRVLLDAQQERLAALRTAFLRAGRRTVEAKADRLGRIDAGRRLPAAWSRLAENAAAGLKQAGALLESSSYRRVLERGFALVRDEQGPIVSAAEAGRRERVEIVFADGEAAARIVKDEAGHARKPDQGRLF